MAWCVLLNSHIYYRPGSQGLYKDKLDARMYSTTNLTHAQRRLEPADTDGEAVNQSQTIIIKYKLSIYLIPSDTFILTSDNTRPPTV